MRKHATIAGRLGTLLATVKMSQSATYAMLLGMWPGSVQSQECSVKEAAVAIMVDSEMLSAGTATRLVIRVGIAWAL